MLHIYLTKFGSYLIYIFSKLIDKIFLFSADSNVKTKFSRDRLKNADLSHFGLRSFQFKNC